MEDEEPITHERFFSLLAGMSREERHDFIEANTSFSAARRKRETKAERKKKERRAKKLRRIRKYRSAVKRAKKGQRSVIWLPDGKKKIVRKKFYIQTWDSRGNPTGTLWYTSAKPSKEEMEAYSKLHKVKHPMKLAKVNSEQMKKKRGK